MDYVSKKKYVSEKKGGGSVAKKITISVPDDLYEKMKAWKNSLNFSRVFQNAILSMIQKKEVLSSKIRNEIDWSSVVARLKKEKIDYEFNIMEWGRKDGLEWCKTAHYTELQYALVWSPCQNPVQDEQLGDYFSEMFEKYRRRIAATGQKAQDWISDFSDRYLKGWKEGVELFWEEVKDKL
jgi:post-segregation antitoxin (ccd killing protein)